MSTATQRANTPTPSATRSARSAGDAARHKVLWDTVQSMVALADRLGVAATIGYDDDGALVLRVPAPPAAAEGGAS